MTHSPSPEEHPFTPDEEMMVLAYAADKAGSLRLSEAIKQAERGIARVKANAVAEHKAQMIPDTRESTTAASKYADGNQDRYMGFLNGMRWQIKRGAR